MLGLVGTVAAGSACRSNGSSNREVVTVTRSAGRWQGTGNQTIGFVSDSGRFEVSWETRNERPAGAGTFRLTVHSAVSGRPLQLLVDHRGEGRGRAAFADDPRPYNFMVESAGVEWAFWVEETLAVERPKPSSD